MIAAIVVIQVQTAVMILWIWSFVSFILLIDINDPKYAEAQAAVKKFYEEAKPFYEKARALKPDQKDLWLQGLYRVYYNLNMGPEFEEIDKMMK